MPRSTYEEVAPSEVRRLVLEEHERVRETLAAADARAEATLAGDSSARLRDVVRDVARALACHITTEEALLVPIVLEIDAWGPIRAERLQCDHAKQGEVVERLASGDFGDELELAWVVRRVVAQVRRDLSQEEEDGLLQPDLLRDDVISIDQLGG